MADEDVDEFTELYDAAIPRVDLVGKGANGLPFLIAKSQGVMPAEFVRDLIAKATPTESHPETQAERTVTVSGSPAAIAEMIAKAPIRQEPVVKKDFDTAERKKDASSGAAMPDGSYPIENKSQLSDAIHAVGRGSGSHDAIRRHIISRAKSLGASSEIPDNWNSDGSIKKASADMADAPIEVDDLIGDASAGGTAETVPGSPDWEQLDADTATAAIGVLARVKACLEWLSDREATEAVTGADPDDAGNALDLQEAACQVDCLIGCLAAFAAGEAIEAGMADELESVGKAVVDVSALLADLEPMAAIAKAGRVLSAQNEGRVKQAAGLLQEVLGSLPAPVNDDGTPVAKSEEDTMTNEVTKAAEDDSAAVTKGITELAEGETAEAVAAGLAEVAKAKGDPQVIVYNSTGKAIGIVDPDKLQPIASEDGAKPDDAAPADDASASDDSAPAEPAADATEQGTDDAAVIPGTDTVQAPAEPDDSASDEDDEDVAKSTEEMVKAAVAESTAELTAELRLLKEQLAVYSQQPAPGGPRLNGATGTPGLAPRDASNEDEVEALRKAAEAETDPKKREELSYIAALAAIRKAQAGHGPYVGQAPVNAAEVLARFTR